MSHRQSYISKQITFFELNAYKAIQQYCMTKYAWLFIAPTLGIGAINTQMHTWPYCNYCIHTATPIGTAQ